MASSFTLDGHRYSIPSELPTQEIRRIVGWMHVGSTDDEVREEIVRRIAGRGTERLTTAAQRYALHCHRKNQSLYAFVSTGSR